MNGLSLLIWVTCSWIAAHLASSGAPSMSIQVVIDSSGTSIFAAVRLEFGDLLGCRVLGRLPERALAHLAQALRHRASLTDAGMACSYSFAGAQTDRPVPSSCSGYQAGSPARSKARTPTSWVRMWSGWP